MVSGVSMRNSIVLIGVFSLIFSIFASSCSEESAANTPSVPSAVVTASTAPQNDRLIFKVTVPHGHHAYLNSGDEGNLIPVTFFWESLIENGVLRGKPMQISSPKGVRDEEVQALVLRGTGAYEFQIVKTAAEKLKGLSLKVRTQVCDESRGICYRPRTDEVMIN